MTETKLKIDESTWHYRLIYYTWKNEHYSNAVPRNFCPYMRKLVMSMIFAPLFFMWRLLPDIITDHPGAVQILFTYGIAVHTIMILITIASGGVASVDYVDSQDIINMYDCSEAFTMNSCDLKEAIEPGSTIDFDDDGTHLIVEHTIRGEPVTSYIQWWWGWAWYLGSLAVVSVVIGVIFGIWALVDKWNDRQRGSTKNETTGLITTYIHAHHSKICPGIEFTNNKKDNETL